MTKALSLMKPDKAARVMRAIALLHAREAREGLSFSNLNLESLFMANDEARPPSRRVPLARRHSGPVCRAPAPVANARSKRRTAISARSRRCSRPSHAISIARTAERAMKLSAELAIRSLRRPRRADFHAALGGISAALAGESRPGEISLPNRRVEASPPPVFHEGDEADRRQGPRRRKAARDRFGQTGRGENRFPRVGSRDRLAEEWGFGRGVVAGDMALFQDSGERDDLERRDFALVDDHMEEPPLSCHVVEYLCKALERCNLVAIATSGEDPLLARADRGGILQAGSHRHGDRASGPRHGREETHPIGSRALARERVFRERARIVGQPRAARLNVIAAASGGGDESRAGGTPFLDTLSGEERTVLAFIAAFGFEAPLSFLLGIYAPEEPASSRRCKRSSPAASCNRARRSRASPAAISAPCTGSRAGLRGAPSSAAWRATVWNRFTAASRTYSPTRATYPRSTPSTTSPAAGRARRRPSRGRRFSGAS